MASSQRQATPDFLLIGTQRGGTTSLFRALCATNTIRAPSRKEIHYFDRYWRLGSRWYLAHFPGEERGRSWLTGEATADYLYALDAPRRASRTTPNARILVLLRDPVYRSHSAWKLMNRKGRDRRTFGEAVEAEIATPVDEGRADLLTRMPLAYLSRGHYVEQLRRWNSYFGRESTLITISEELFSRDSAAAEISRFLGITETLELPHLYATRADEIDPGVHRMLREYFDPHIRDLAEYLDRDLPW